MLYNISIYIILYHIYVYDKESDILIICVQHEKIRISRKFCKSIRSLKLCRKLNFIFVGI